ncbi:MAG: antibiotic biosynthesis monooxygenase family protein [Terriglobales bacterium]
MIARIWHGYTTPTNADAYEQLLRTTILPGIHRVKGYQGAYLLRREAGAEIEFITVTLWASMEAVREFAGGDKVHAVVPPDAQKLLSRYDQQSVHYDATWCP